MFHFFFVGGEETYFKSNLYILTREFVYKIKLKALHIYIEGDISSALLFPRTRRRNCEPRDRSLIRDKTEEQSAVR